MPYSIQMARLIMMNSCGRCEVPWVIEDERWSTRPLRYSTLIKWDHPKPSEVVRKYDASRHPDVLNGDKTEDDVLREFLDTFDVGGIVDGKVTRQELELLRAERVL